MKKLNGGSSIISDNVLVYVREKLNEENSFWIPLYAYKEKYLNDLKEDITIVIGLPEDANVFHKSTISSLVKLVPVPSSVLVVIRLGSSKCMPCISSIITGKLIL